MLSFVIPLQAPQASRRWDLVSRLCVRTLGSVCQQRGGSWRALLVCNEPPARLPAHPGIRVLTVDLPPPATAEQRMQDKWAKVKRGLVELRWHGSQYVMIVDADDCVHRDLAAHCDERRAPHGWIVDVGYLHDRGSRWLLRRRGFDAVCGTSSIVRCDEDDLPRSVDDDPRGSIVLRAGHTVIRAACAARGTPLEPLPFGAVVYNLATGENDSGTELKALLGRRARLRSLLDHRLLTPWRRRAFNLWDV